MARTARKKIAIKDEGIVISDDADSIDFTGSGVTGSAPDGRNVTENIGGGSGTIPGSTGDILYNNAGVLGAITVIPLANGGTGIPNTITVQPSTGIFNALASATTITEFTGSAGGITLNGIDAQPNGTRIYFLNTANGSFIINNQNSSATAAKRIVVSSNVNIRLPAGFMYELVYDTSISRWRLTDGLKFSSLLAPLTLSGSQLAINQVTTGQDGYLTSAQYIALLAKGGVPGIDGDIPFKSGTDFAALDEFNVNPTTGDFGVGLLLGDVEAKTHFKSGDIQTASSIASFTAGYDNTISPPSDVTFAQATQTQGNLDGATSFSGSSVGNSSPFNPGDVLDFIIYTYSQSGPDRKYSKVTAATSVMIVNAADCAALTWSDPVGPNFQTVAGYKIIFQVNGGGYNYCRDTGLTTSYNINDLYTDDATVTPVWDDFVADGTTRNYDIYGKFTYAGISGNLMYYSENGFPYSLTDDNSGLSYQVTHIVSNIGTDDYKVLGALDGVSANDSFIEDVSMSGTYIETPATWGSGDAVVTPNTYGYAPNSETYTYIAHPYQTLSGVKFFGPAFTPVMVTDFGFSIFEINISIGYGLNNDGVVIVRQRSGSEPDDYIDIPSVTTDFSDNLGATWIVGSPILTPTTYVKPANILETAASASTNPFATQVFKSTLLGDFYFAMDYRDADDTLLGTISFDGSLYTIFGGMVIGIGGNFIKINNVPISFPSTQGDTNSFLYNDGFGNLTWKTRKTNVIPTGSGTSFTISGAEPIYELGVYAAGQRLTPTVDYSISGHAITTVNSWSAGQILVDYTS